MRAIASIAAMLLTAGCASDGYTWSKAQHIERVRVVKIETQLAVDFCSALLGSPKRGCTARMRNGDTGEFMCVVVMLPNDGAVAAHEGGHCMGYDH
jgi:hypothetical protein